VTENVNRLLDEVELQQHAVQRAVGGIEQKGEDLAGDRDRQDQRDKEDGAEEALEPQPPPRGSLT
jgi:hypothetical protein